MADSQGRTDRMVASVAHVFSWFSDGSWERHHLDPGIADFTFGNPQELPLPGLVDALQRHAVPQDKDWFAYKMSEEEPRTVVAESLRRRTGIAYRAEDVAMTAGAFGALGVTIRALCDVGDEVIYLSPPWFFYELMIASAGRDGRARATSPSRRSTSTSTPSPRRSRRAPGRSSSTRRTTRPGGSTASPSCTRWARSCATASARHGRTIVLVSDESYNRIVFDGIDFRSPALDYDATALIYTYGKTTLAPGQRIGFVALHPSFPDAGTVGYRIFVHQLAAGWGFPNALLQHAIRDLEGLSIDIAALQARRDRMVPALREMGYEATRPEGTFYLMVRSPDPDDLAFTDRLAELGALVLPGTIVEKPGWFRVSLTASDEMVERGLEAFRAAASTPVG